MRLRRLTIAGTVAAALAVGSTLVACGTEYTTATVAEDCDVEDQEAREDDCGYWQHSAGDLYRTGAQPGVDWFWIWYTWVVVGQTSTPPAGWRAPHNLKHPTKTVRVDRKNCALGAGELRIAPPPPARPPVVNPPAVRPPAGGGGNPAPAPAKPKPPAYKPPAGTKVRC